MPDQITNASRRPEGASLQAHSLKAMVAEEARRFVVLFLYLWVLFAVFVLNQSIVLREQGIGFTAQCFAAVNARSCSRSCSAPRPILPGRVRPDLRI